MKRMGLTAWALLLYFDSAAGLGLGDLRVDSALHDTLNARIDLVKVSPGDIDAISVRLADDEAFKSAGLERSYVLSQLRFEAVGTAENAGYIRVTSTERIREPYLNFIIEVQWPNGKTMREYTILLKTP
ncbi:MAG: hypothetical protein R3174_03745 [Gammaproteobacteria bacterium]|nr:hypothetical protein [Gammaproteobacteria bacterium]